MPAPYHAKLTFRGIETNISARKRHHMPGVVIDLVVCLRRFRIKVTVFIGLIVIAPPNGSQFSRKQIEREIMG
jgi:hypothetical protein